MGNIAIGMAIALLAVIVVIVAVRLRSTPSLGGTIRLTDQSDSPSSTELLLKKALAASGTGKPVITIAMTTTRGGSGEPVSQEVITVDGQTYRSIEEIPPDVRDHVRKVLAESSRKGSPNLPSGGTAMAKIESDLVELGLDLHGPGEPVDPPAPDS